MILRLKEEGRSFTVGFKGERFTVTASPLEVPDDVGNHIFRLFGQYLIKEETVIEFPPVLIEPMVETAEESPPLYISDKPKHKRKNK